MGMNLIIKPKGKAQNVSNLGWLIRHGREVTQLTFIRVYQLPLTYETRKVIKYDYDGLIIAELENGTRFISTYASESVFHGWMKRNRTMKHLTIDFDNPNLSTINYIPKAGANPSKRITLQMVKDKIDLTPDETQIVTGVIQNNNAYWLGDEWVEGIDLTFEDSLTDHKKVCQDEDCIDSDHQPEIESWEIDYSDYLIGDWKRVGEKFEFDREGKSGYAAISRESVTQVVWSNRVVMVRRMCSPCYPNQADYDSGIVEKGGFYCYALPEEIINEV